MMNLWEMVVGAGSTFHCARASFRSGGAGWKEGHRCVSALAAIAHMYHSILPRRAPYSRPWVAQVLRRRGSRIHALCGTQTALRPSRGHLTVGALPRQESLELPPAKLERPKEQGEWGSCVRTVCQDATCMRRAKGTSSSCTTRQAACLSKLARANTRGCRIPGIRAERIAHELERQPWSQSSPRLWQLRGAVREGGQGIGCSVHVGGFGGTDAAGFVARASAGRRRGRA